MKILVLSFYFTPDLCAGSFRCASLIKELMKQIGSDDSIELITTLPNRYSSFNQEVAEFEEHDQILIHRIKLPPHKSGMKDQVKSFYHFYRLAFNKSKHHDYDLVIATSSRLFTAFLGAQIAKKKSAKLYLDIRDIFVDTLKDILPKKNLFIMLPFLKFIERFTFKSAGKINLVSEGFKGYFSKFQPLENLDFFTNGIDEEFITDVVPQKITLPVKVLYAGNIGEGQGLHKIIPQICMKTKINLDFTVIGDGGQLSLLKGKIDELGIKNIKLLPPVSRQELKAFYNNSDILFLHLNAYSAFEKVLPSKVFEYGSLGKPIWAGVAGYASKFIKENLDNAVVFEPTSCHDALLEFDKLKLEVGPRTEFVGNFKREAIMEKMVASILEFGHK